MLSEKRVRTAESAGLASVRSQLLSAVYRSVLETIRLCFTSLQCLRLHVNLCRGMKQKLKSLFFRVLNRRLWINPIFLIFGNTHRLVLQKIMSLKLLKWSPTLDNQEWCCWKAYFFIVFFFLSGTLQNHANTNRQPEQLQTSWPSDYGMFLTCKWRNREWT